MGRSGSERQNKLEWRIGIEEQTLPRTASNRLPKNWSMRRTCCAEAHRARQAGVDELSMHQERNPATLRRLLTQSQDLQNKVNSLSDAREFYDLKQRAVLERPTFPVRTLLFRVPEPCLAAILRLPHNSRNIMGTSGNVFERLPAREGQTSTQFNDAKNLASSSQKLGPGTEGNTKRPESEMRREPQHLSIPVPRFQSGGGLLCHTGGT